MGNMKLVLLFALAAAFMQTAAVLNAYGGDAVLAAVWSAASVLNWLSAALTAATR